MPKIEEVSVDEVMEKRKEFSNDDGILYKAAASPKSWDDATRSATFVMSAETEDRHRDIVIQSGIKLDHFNNNPIAFFNHKAYEPPIGGWSDIKTVAGRPKRTEGLFTACDEGVDEIADRVARHLAAGTIRASSIGFRPLKMSRILDDQDNWTYGYKFDEIELFECSVVTIPAVREALMKGAGNIKDIMSPEVVEEFLEQIKSNPAVAQLVDKKLFEQAYAEATGNKTFIIPKGLSDDQIAMLRKTIENAKPAALEAPKTEIKVGIDTSEASEFLTEFKGLVERAEKAAGIEAPEPVIEADPVAKEIEDGVTDIVEKFTPQIEEIEDEARKSALSVILDSFKSIFAKDEPAPEPVLASDEAKAALQKRLTQLRAADALE